MIKQQKISESSYPVVYKAISAEKNQQLVGDFVSKYPEYQDCVGNSPCVSPSLHGFNGLVWVWLTDKTEFSPDLPPRRELKEEQKTKVREFILANAEYFGIKDPASVGEFGEVELKEDDGAPIRQYHLYQPGAPFFGTPVSIYAQAVDDRRAIVLGHFWPVLPAENRVQPFADIIHSLKGLEYYEAYDKYSEESVFHGSGQKKGASSAAQKRKFDDDIIAQIAALNSAPKLMLHRRYEEQNLELGWVYFADQGPFKVAIDAVLGAEAFWEIL